MGERTPDLLQITETGFTLWQCKPEIKVDDEFLAECDEMRAAAETVGWGFVLFTGMPTVERLNLMWLNGFRVSRPWHQKCVGPIVAAASHEDACLDDLFALDDGGGETISTTWHLLWTGELITDLSVTLRSVTQVRHR